MSDFLYGLVLCAVVILVALVILAIIEVRAAFARGRRKRSSDQDTEQAEPKARRVAGRDRVN